MRKAIMIVSALGALSLGACTQKEDKVSAAGPPPLPPGAVAGSMAADRDGDGIIDGYYSPDGIYHANQPVYAPAPVQVSRRGERG
jgi:hypothetical protein